MNFADALVGVVAQRLVRTLCGKCKQGYIADEEEWEKIIHLYDEEMFAIDFKDINTKEHELFKPMGCEKCGQSGYRGRIGIHEVLMGTAPMKKLVSKSAPVPELVKQAVDDGMRTLLQDGLAKVINGHADMAMVRKVAYK